MKTGARTESTIISWAKSIIIGVIREQPFKGKECGSVRRLKARKEGMFLRWGLQGARIDVLLF